jgi:8-amino-7-oxononanoate synthase
VFTRLRVRIGVFLNACSLRDRCAAPSALAIDLQRDDGPMGVKRLASVVLDASVKTSLDSALAADLAALQAAHLDRHLRIIARVGGAAVRTDAGEAIDFSSNDYLGLATDARLAAAAGRALSEFGTGAAAARLISGNNPEHGELERELAAFLGVERVLTFSNGYAANVGAIPALATREDVIFADRLNHASLIDGCRLSRAEVCVYAHTDVDALGELLAARRHRHRRALIVTDGMFSMDGDTAPLAQIASLARQFDAWTYVDDAHAVGVVGVHGRGSIETCGVQNQIDILVGTLGKAFGSAGAFVAGSAALGEYLVNRARSFVFSTAAPAAQAAASREALRVIESEPELRARAIANVGALRDALAARGIPSLGDTDSHIVPIPIGDAARTMAIGEALAARGFLVGAVRPPTVPEGTSRLRVTVSAAHTPRQILEFAVALGEAMHA